jgi:hypothetical protein
MNSRGVDERSIWQFPLEREKMLSPVTETLYLE